MVLRVHLIPNLGSRPLDEIKSEDVQHLKHSLGMKAVKTVNNVLTVLNVLLKTAVEWAVIKRILYRPGVLGQWFDGIRSYATASSRTRSCRTWAGLR